MIAITHKPLNVTWLYTTLGKEFLCPSLGFSSRFTNMQNERHDKHEEIQGTFRLQTRLEATPVYARRCSSVPGPFERCTLKVWDSVYYQQPRFSPNDTPL